MLVFFLLWRGGNYLFDYKSSIQISNYDRDKLLKEIIEINNLSVFVSMLDHIKM